MSNKKRIWSREELIIAYYIAKWDYYGLKISEHDFVEFVIGNTTVPSLRMQVANFRFLLGLDGYKLTHASKAMADLVNELENKTISQVRKMISAYVDECAERIQILSLEKKKLDLNKKKDEANAQLQVNFEKELERKSKGRNLRSIGKRKIIK